MIATARSRTAATAPRKACPKCGFAVLRAKRACCGDRRKGIAWRLSCSKCSYKEIVKR